MVEKAHIITSPLRFNGYFKNNLKTHLGDCQYRIKLKKDLTGMATVTRNPQLHTPKVNAVFNDLGIQRETFSSKLASELGKNKVKILSKLYVVVADRIE